MDEDQVAYFCKEDYSIDFDVYRWEKGDEYTLKFEVNYFAAEYGTTTEVVTVNGINCMKYVFAEELEGETYTVVNHMFEEDTNIVEICFWTVNFDEEYAAVDEVLKLRAENEFCNN